MHHILFVCHGNICRSAMAEYMMKQAVRDARREPDFEITSAAVSYEEEGNGMYPPAQAKLREHGVPFGRHRAHRITLKEFQDADLVIVMDRSNARLLERIVGPSEKVHKMMEYGGHGQDVADPWYSGDFEATYQDLKQAVTVLLQQI